MNFYKYSLSCRICMIYLLLSNLKETVHLDRETEGLSFCRSRPPPPSGFLPKDHLASLGESILVTHWRTWDDCQQLLQTLLTSEEKQKVLLEAHKNVPGDDGRPTQLPNLINEAFPLTRPDWDYNTDAGRNHLRLYRQLLIAGLHGAGRRPTNLAQVRQTTQGPEETPTAFLERLKEAYQRYTPFDPDSEDQRGNISMAFIWQSAPDIRTKLQRLDDLRDFSLADLLREAEKIFNKRETPEEKEERIRKMQEERDLKFKEELDKRDRKHNKELSKILATVAQAGQRGDKTGKERKRGRPRVDRDQCAYCKERGHWVKDCPKKPPNPRRGTNRTPQLLALDLLVFVDTFSGWVEAFPTRHETAKVVAKKLLEEIFPRYGVPETIGSDNGPAFVSQVSQANALGINWKLHCAYRPQSSGQVERMNRTIKETLTKLTLETGTRDWVQLLPLALYRAQNTPSPQGLTPFEILYGAPPPAINKLKSMPPLPHLCRLICAHCNWSRTRFGNHWQRHIRKNSKPPWCHIRSKSGTPSGYAGIRIRTLNHGGRDPIPSC
uniref:uncharacterized protein LOC120889225 isoform X2 n=1 Tax=Ictidomys tridecemlineatus TaxID=43179 RepID=UPI001A9D5262|nr:uncharacterized protein LOC120889225 isoform X2 [Ictidomys tridecemlineatus]